MDHLNYEKIIEKYSLNKLDLNLLFESISSFLRKKGITIHFVDLEPVIETDVYKISKKINPEDKHHETCISDGKNIWLHNDLDDSGGIVGRLYDIIHVGLGHLWQWSANKESGYSYWGEKAWEMGTKSFLFSSENDLKKVWTYEEEASRIAIYNLKNILLINKFNKDFIRNCLQLFNDYCVTDLYYITNYYKTGKVVDFYENWKLYSDNLKYLSSNVNFFLKKRKNKCLSLLKN